MSNSWTKTTQLSFGAVFFCLLALASERCGGRAHSNTNTKTTTTTTKKKNANSYLVGMVVGDWCQRVPVRNFDSRRAVLGSELAPHVVRRALARRARPARIERVAIRHSNVKGARCETRNTRARETKENNTTLKSNKKKQSNTIITIKKPGRFASPLSRNPVAGESKSELRA